MRISPLRAMASCLGLRPIVQSRSGSKCRHEAARCRTWTSAALLLIAMIAGSGAAAAHTGGNHKEVSCSSAGTFKGTLCQDGGTCGQNGFPNNPTDILHVLGVTANTKIKFTFKALDADPVATTVDIMGQGAGNSFTQLDLAVPNAPTTIDSNTYAVTTIDAVDGDSTFQVTVDNNPGAGIAAVEYTIMCTPPAAPKLRIVKQAINTVDAVAPPAFPFVTNTPAGNFSLTPSNPAPSSAQTNVITLSAGTPYSIVETPQAGWTLGSPVQCVNTGAGNLVVTPVANGATFTPEGDQDITCTFVNARQQPDLGSLTIIKKILGQGGTAFDFTTTGGNQLPAGFVLTPAVEDGTAQAQFSLTAGPYTVTEQAEAGWNFTSLVCNGTPINGPVAPISIVAGQSTTCTFTNTQQPGQLTIIKQIEGPGGTTFDFTTSGGGGLPTNLSLTPAAANGSAQQIFAVTPGSYTVTELNETGWTLTNIVCNGTTFAAPTGQITVGAGESKTCTFNNKADGRSITITKATVNGDGSFTVTPSQNTGSAAFSLTTANGVGTNPQTISNLAPGVTYTFTELVPAGWTLTGFSCTGTQSFSLNGNVGSVTPNIGESPICTFTNTRQQRSIAIRKVTIGGDGTFKITPSANANAAAFDLTTVNGTSPTTTIASLPVGNTYTFTETVAAGFALTGFSCTGTQNFSLNGNVGSVTLYSNETPTCTFTNTRQTASVTIAKTASSGGPATFGFTSNIPGNAAFSIATNNNTQQTVISNIPTGSYTVTESVLAGWTLSSLSCNDANSSGNVASRTATINLEPGENVICTYVNTRDSGLVTIIKTTLGGDDTFSFTGSGITSFTQSVTTVSGTGTSGALSVNTGTLTITEAAVSTYDLSNIACSGGSPQFDLASRNVSINVTSNARIACTFTNTRRGSITVRKNTIGGDATFGFASSNAALPSFSLTTSGGTAARVSSNLSTGTYAVTETVAEGWTLSALQCSGGASTSVSTQTKTATVNLRAGENITCTFTNTEVRNRTSTIIRNFLKRRADLLTSDTGRPRLIERQQAGAAMGSIKDGPMKLSGSGDDRVGVVTFATSLSQLRAAAAAQAEAKRRGELAGDQSDATLPAGLGMRPEQDGAPPANRFGLAKLGPDKLGADKLGQDKLGMHETYQPSARVARPGVDVWVEGTYTYFDSDADGVGSTPSDSTSGRFSMLRVGTDYLLRPWLLVGALVQFDSMSEKSVALGYRVDGNGWMAGPYVEMQLSPHLIFDVKGLWGRSNNHVSPFLTYTDSFSTERWLLSARLTGSWTQGNWHFSPRAEVVGFNDASKAYTDSLGILIPGQSVTLGRFIVGPEVAYRHQTQTGGIIEPRFAIKGLWTFSQDKTQHVLGTSVPDARVDEFRVRLEAGVKLQDAGGTRLEFSGSHEGLGESRLNATSGKVQLTVPLN